MQQQKDPKLAKHPQKEVLEKPLKILIKNSLGEVVKVKTVQYEPSMTNQDFAKEVEINNIIDRFTKTGELPSSVGQQLVYGDFTQNRDYMSTLNRIKSGKDLFHQLNEKLDNQFNDPEELASFMSDPKNENLLIQKGIFPKRDKPDDANKEENPPKTKTKNDSKKTKSPDEGEE